MNKKKVFSYLFIGLLAAGATGTMTSCKDYDEDIQNLQKQITENANAIKAINDLIKEGSVIKSVDPVENGVKVTLSNGKDFTIKNGENGVQGAPGKDGVSWRIGEKGYWEKNEGNGWTATTYYALGTKGEQGEKGEKGEKGDPGDAGASAKVSYYVPNSKTGCFDLYEDGVKVKETNISWKSAEASVITAAMDKENLILTGVTGVDGGTVVISLSGVLKSLVFKPMNYFDGIETIIYPYLTGNTLANKAISATKNYQDKKVTGLDDYQTSTKEFNYGPAVGYDYHMNPSNSNVKASDLLRFNVLEPEVVYTKTRAAASALGVTAVKENTDKYVFSNKDGVLHAGMQIAHPNLLAEYPTSNTEQKSNTVALQVNSKDMQGGDAVVTSDYALLQPQKAKVAAIYWAKKPMYAKAGKDNTIKGDVALCNTHSGTKIDVFDTPEAALQNTNGAALELYYETGSTLNVKNYLGIHALRQNVTSDPIHGFVAENWLAANGDEKEFGLTYNFKLVDYAVDGNTTRDSRFAKWSDGTQAGKTTTDGTLVAQNLKADGQTPDPDATAKTAIDREPLVQVTVTNKYGEVVLDGYILIHITSTPPEAPNNKTISYESIEHSKTFDLCDEVGLLTTWGQFNDIVLKSGLDLKKEDFDAQYTADLLTETMNNPVSGVVGTEMKQYETPSVKGDANEATTYPHKVGKIYYYGEGDGTTNHAFYWLITNTEAEKLTKGLKPGETKDVVRYVRYFATQNDDGSYAANAKYPYLYIKLVMTLTRAAVPTVTFAEKINNYWFDATTGADNGTNAIVLDVREPRDGGNINAFSRNINTTLVNNEPKAAGKYFVTSTATTVKGQNGVTYTISGKSNKLVNKYDNSELTYTAATYNEIVNTNAIDYTKGVLANNAIYATPAGGQPVLIATLNQDNGEITLDNNATTKIVLNAVGYEANHANINKELRAWIGFVGQTGCGLATQIAEAPFLASWQRPINLNPVSSQAFLDANTNGNYIYLADILKFFDWRNEAFDMLGNNTWFMNYYGINAITVDVTPGKVYTDMHDGDLNKTTLASVTTKAHIYTESANGGKEAASHKFTFKSDFTGLNAAAKNADAKKYIEDHKSEFGYIYYENNGDNVQKFNIKVPVTVSYTWGDFKTYVTISIDRTKNN